MTDEQIRELAREISEELHKDTIPFFLPKPFPESYEVLIQQDVKRISEIISILSERYALVEKDKVREIHAYWGDCMRRYSSSTRREYRSRQMGVETIFGKDIFNEEKK